MNAKERPDTNPPRQLIGRSEAMQRLLARVDRAASCDIDVLLHGESGTGKELVAHAIHQRSARREAPFEGVNCASLPVLLFEDKFFGHVKGAYTGAITTSAGLFSKACGGTVFLDEMDELLPELQPKLLRVLQERTVRPLGSTEEVPLDVRVIVASSRNLRKLMEKGMFLNSLFYRIQVDVIELPPLRERHGDVPLLADHFCSRYSKAGQPIRFSDGAMRALDGFNWPGNVRELENLVKRLVATRDGGTIEVDEIPEEIRCFNAIKDETVAFYGQKRAESERFEKNYIQELLSAHGGDVGRAARAAGMHRSTLYRKLKLYCFEPEDFRSGPPSHQR